MKKQEGFSTVELLVTLFIAVAFIAIFYQMFTVIGQRSTAALQKASASNEAYTQLRKYASGMPANTWFRCDANTDLDNYPDASGQVLIDASSSDGYKLDLPAPYSLKVVAIAPYGCYAANSDTPIQVESTLVYGPDQRKVTHATYVQAQ